ncbi:hypothetical protein GM418_08500 [Maribellus comscasis]|uniref:HYR domain-containing protein n=1 Tax=Maribellus comscasis TaxID=2681766 RepID=A0A6I6JX41_9BACT|nr:hypothetical protein [Maribellus comscasis]QGY43693.1 hypothetical protein GM418_08500 [Maribellus comscasis]
MRYSDNNSYIHRKPGAAADIDSAADKTVDACDFDDTSDNLTAAQNALNADFDAWLAAQAAAVAEGGGCSPTLSNDWDNSYIDFCAGGSITITWTVTDICDTQTTTATYTVNPVPPLTLTQPADKTVDACDFDDTSDNLTAAQNALNADFDAWLAAQAAAVAEGGGCSPTLSNDWDNSYIDFCAGGSITITWTVTDICDTQTTTATYTVNPVPPLTLTQPADKNSRCL